jgi:hypothetical protein
MAWSVREDEDADPLAPDLRVARRFCLIGMDGTWVRTYGASKLSPFTSTREVLPKQSQATRWRRVHPSLKLGRSLLTLTAGLENSLV